jgi:integrase
MTSTNLNDPASAQRPWNKDKLIGPKRPLELKQVWAIRNNLQLAGCIRDLCLFNLAIDSKLRACDVVTLETETVAPRGYALERATVRQRKTGQPVKFEITEPTRESIDAWLSVKRSSSSGHLFVGRNGRHLSTRQYARLLDTWLKEIGLDSSLFGTHSIRRTKATLIYRRTGNLRAVQLLLGHSKIESTVRYLGVEVDDALAIAEGIDV